MEARTECGGFSKDPSSVENSSSGGGIREIEEENINEDRSLGERSNRDSMVNPTSTIKAVLDSRSEAEGHSPESGNGMTEPGTVQGCNPHMTVPKSQREGSTQRTTETIDSKATPKPWTNKVAHMRVEMPPRGTPNRIARLKRANEVMSQFLGNTPYVEFAWSDSCERSLALLDSGADWSLIDEAGMTREERELILPTELEGKGVGGEPVPIVGEIWRSVEIGGVVVSDQRFWAFQWLCEE